MARSSSVAWLVSFLTLLLAASSCTKISFERTYGGPNQDTGHSVQQTQDGGYIIVGSTYAYPTRDDVYLVKTDALGNTLWTKAYGGPNRDTGHSVQQTRDGGYIIVGSTYAYPTGYDVYLVKTDSLGNTLWTKTYGGSDREAGHSVRQTRGGGYIIVGTTRSYGAGNGDIYLIKTDPLGDTLWTRTYGDVSSDRGYSAQQTSDGGYIVSGSTMSFGKLPDDVYLIKLDSEGHTLWARNYGGPSLDAGRCVKQTSDGGYVIAGWSVSFGAGGYDVYLIRTDSLGDTLWTRTYGGVHFDFGYCVEQTSDKGYIITGYTKSFGAGKIDVYLVKTDSRGNLRWTRTYGGSGYDRGNCVQQTSEGGYIIAGGTSSFGAGSSDMYLIKTDKYGRVVAPEERKSAKLNTETTKSHRYQPYPMSWGFDTLWQTQESGAFRLRDQDGAPVEQGKREDAETQRD